MFYITLTSVKRRKRANSMHIPETLVNNSDGVSKDNPFGPELYNPVLIPTQSKLVSRQYHEPTEHYYYNQYRTKKEFLYAGVVIGIVAVIVIVGILLYRLLKHFDLYSIAPERMPNIQPECNHPTCGQYCTLPTDNSHDNTAYTIHHSFHLLNVAGLLPSNTEMNNAHINALDLPPSYDSSMRNSSTVSEDKDDFPPSYNEALSYMSANDRLTLNNNARSLP